MGVPPRPCQLQLPSGKCQIGYHVGDMGTRFAWALVVMTLVACGGRPPIPKRGVVEGDLGDWKFRRFQPVLDVEVWVEGNHGEAYTASYVRGDAEKRGRIEPRDLCSVMVTRFSGDVGVLRETV